MTDHDIEFLKNPLTTEEGFINEACLNELSSWIKNIPRTYDRLSDDPEWNTPRCTALKEITGKFALWAVRQGDYHNCPPNLENIISYLDTCLRREFEK